MVTLTYPSDVTSNNITFKITSPAGVTYLSTDSAVGTTYETTRSIQVNIPDLAQVG